MHMAQLMPLPLTLSCFSKIQIGFTFLVPAYLGSPRERAVKSVCMCVCVCYMVHSMQLVNAPSASLSAYVVAELRLVFLCYCGWDDVCIVCIS